MPGRLHPERQYPHGILPNEDPVPNADVISVVRWVKENPDETGPFIAAYSTDSGINSTAEATLYTRHILIDDLVFDLRYEDCNTWTNPVGGVGTIGPEDRLVISMRSKYEGDSAFSYGFRDQGLNGFLYQRGDRRNDSVYADMLGHPQAHAEYLHAVKVIKEHIGTSEKKQISPRDGTPLRAASSPVCEDREIDPNVKAIVDYVVDKPDSTDCYEPEADERCYQKVITIGHINYEIEYHDSYYCDKIKYLFILLNYGEDEIPESCPSDLFMDIGLDGMIEPLHTKYRFLSPDERKEYFSQEDIDDMRVTEGAQAFYRAVIARLKTYVDNLQH